MRSLSLAVALLVSSCSAAPVSPESPAVAPEPATRDQPEPGCLEGRIAACPCAAGKGYRLCADGRLGDCVCRLVGDRRPGSDLDAARADPTTAPHDVAAPPADALRTPSGLAYKILRSGTGAVHPSPTSRITVHYSGWTTDGKLFDSSHPRNRPAVFPLQHLIPGWTEGLQLLVVGDLARFWIPEALAYQGKPGRPQGMLVFDVELLAIN